MQFFTPSIQDLSRTASCRSGQEWPFSPSCSGSNPGHAISSHVCGSLPTCVGFFSAHVWAHFPLEWIVFPCVWALNRVLGPLLAYRFFFQDLSKSKLQMIWIHRGMNTQSFAWPTFLNPSSFKITTYLCYHSKKFSQKLLTNDGCKQKISIAKYLTPQGL